MSFILGSSVLALASLDGELRAAAKAEDVALLGL